MDFILEHNFADKDTVNLLRDAFAFMQKNAFFCIGHDIGSKRVFNQIDGLCVDGLDSATLGNLVLLCYEYNLFKDRAFQAFVRLYSSFIDDGSIHNLRILFLFVSCFI